MLPTLQRRLSLLFRFPRASVIAVTTFVSLPRRPPNSLGAACSPPSTRRNPWRLAQPSPGVVEPAVRSVPLLGCPPMSDGAMTRRHEGGTSEGPRTAFGKKLRRSPRLRRLRQRWALCLGLGCVSMASVATAYAGVSKGTAGAGGTAAPVTAGVVSGSAPAPAPVAASALLPVGSVAPAFTATAHDGQAVDLAKLKGHFVVLYFYPKDDTPGCTKEACEFRDTWGALQKQGVAVYGVSTQDIASHKAFADKHHIPFPLIPDEKGMLAAQYKVPVLDGKARRITYLIGPDGRIRQVWPSVNPIGHAAEVMKAIGPAPAPAK